VITENPLNRLLYAYGSVPCAGHPLLDDRGNILVEVGPRGERVVISVMEIVRLTVWRAKN
jgi:hypothetical protein